MTWENDAALAARLERGHKVYVTLLVARCVVDRQQCSQSLAQGVGRTQGGQQFRHPRDAVALDAAARVDVGAIAPLRGSGPCHPEQKHGDPGVQACAAAADRESGTPTDRVPTARACGLAAGASPRSVGVQCEAGHAQF